MLDEAVKIVVLGKLKRLLQERAMANLVKCGSNFLRRKEMLLLDLAKW